MSTEVSDKGIGYGVLLGALALVSALVPLFAPGSLAGALGFAGAIVFGLLLVVALHVYDDGSSAH